MSRTVLFLASVLLSACAPQPAALPHGAQTFKPSLLEVAVDTSRSVGLSADGPTISGLSATTEVWAVTQQWADITPEAGMAWPANSGLTWDEKYAAWIDAMQSTQSDDTHTTVELITPWGRTLPMGRMECAETALFLRASFAAWHGLPFFLRAYSPQAQGNVYYGHFGMVDSSGARVSGSPRFASDYVDYTGTSWTLATWPSDATLDTRSLTLTLDDHNDFLGPDLYAGAYFDEVHLNKRVGYFLLRLLTDFGSIHLADAGNAWNLEPSETRTGDLLLHRWQPTGIGHAMIVKEVVDYGDGQIDAEIMYGSMPRIQPRWYGASISQSYFVNQKAGGPDLAPATGEPYSRLGGGLKRWRTPVERNGRWTNIVPQSDEPAWIGSTDYPALEARIAELVDILGERTPEEQRDTLLERIDMARSNLAIHPSSCTNRERREEAFDELYTLMDTEFGWTASEVDATYRLLEDYVFAELDYTSSKTCCWNSTTPAMYDLVVDFAEEELAAARANGQCVEPTVFRARDGGYDPFRQHAIATGHGADWVEWSADEDCPQAAVLDDTEIQPAWTDLCSIVDAVVGCADPAGCDPVDPDPTDPTDPTGGSTGPQDGESAPGDGGSCGGCNAVGPMGMLTFSMLGVGLTGLLRRRW